MVSSVTITRRGEQRLRNGHPWIYKSDIQTVAAAAGDVVAVVDSRGQRAGHALFSDRSEIALRRSAPLPVNWLAPVLSYGLGGGAALGIVVVLAER